MIYASYGISIAVLLAHKCYHIILDDGLTMEQPIIDNKVDALFSETHFGVQCGNDFNVFKHDGSFACSLYIQDLRGAVALSNDYIFVGRDLDTFNISYTSIDVYNFSGKRLKNLKIRATSIYASNRNKLMVVYNGYLNVYKQGEVVKKNRLSDFVFMYDEVMAWNDYFIVRDYNRIHYIDRTTMKYLGKTRIRPHDFIQVEHDGLYISDDHFESCKIACEFEMSLNGLL